MNDKRSFENVGKNWDFRYKDVEENYWSLPQNAATGKLMKKIFNQYKKIMKQQLA